MSINMVKPIHDYKQDVGSFDSGFTRKLSLTKTA